MRRVVFGLGLCSLLLAVTTARAEDGPANATSLPFLKAGETVAAFSAEGMDGAVRRVEFPQGTTTVLVFFSTGCPVCHRMIPEWNRVFGARPKNVAMIGIVVDHNVPPAFFQQVPVLFPVLKAPGETFLNDFKIRRVPVTLRIAPGGHVEDIGVGILDVMRLNQLLHP